MTFNLNLTPEQQQSRAQVPLPYAHEGAATLHCICVWVLIYCLTGKPAPTATPAAILYDPDSADDLDDDDPDEDLDI